MNANVAKALILDAFYQVVDNKVFRLLLGLELFVVLVFLCIGFGKDEVRVFWVWSFPYTSMLAGFGQHFSANADLQGIVIQALQRFVVEKLCGTFGMIVCLSATSFFLPRMLEKGAADIVFAKPVSRLALMLSRYVSGLVFVGLLAVLGLAGLWAAFLVGSGYNDLGVMWGAVTLVYIFAILHAVSILLGVLTRSTVAAILVSIVFFAGNGCVHDVWALRANHQDERARLRRDVDETTPAPAEPESSTALRVLGTSLDVLHLVLPKTGDADVLTQKLRKSVEREPWKLVDEAAQITIPHPPPGLEIVAPAGDAKTVDLSSTPVVFASPDGKARIEVSRRARQIERVDPSGKTPPRKRNLSSAQAADEVVTRVRATGRATGEIKTERTELDDVGSVVVSWKEGERGFRTYVAAFDDSVLELAVSADGLAAPSERSRVRIGEGEEFELAPFLHGVSMGRPGIPDQSQWYEQRLAWNGPISSNIAFSIASSLLFVAFTLGLAWLKLRKIDF